MKKTAFSSLSAALLLSGMMVGCGANNNGAMGNRHNNDGARPIGFHTDNARNNNLPGVRDNNLSDNNTYHHRLNNDRDNDLGMGNGVIDNDGANDHNGPNANGTVTKHRRQAKSIANRVADLTGVENTSVVVTDDNVLIGVKSKNANNRKNFKGNIRRTAQTVVRGKDIHVTTDKNMYNRIKNVSHNLTDGDGMGEVSSDVKGIINDMANAAKRPFQNNHH